MNQAESALIIKLRETIPWESALEIAEQGTLTPINPVAALDARRYQRRDRELAYRDLLGAAAVAEVSLQVSSVWNFSTIQPRMQGPASFEMVNNPTEQSFSGTAATVRHVGYGSVPYDAAQYSDKDLYGRDAILYQTLAKAASIFEPPPIPEIDLAGTIPMVTAWSLAEGVARRADISPSLPLNRDLFKYPDQNLADRDNQLAGYVSRLAQTLRDPFAYANRIYVAVEKTEPREPEIYVLARPYWQPGSYPAGAEVFHVEQWFRALINTGEEPAPPDWQVISGPTVRQFVPEPALTNRNRILYHTEARTLQWFREVTSQVHVPQIAALEVPGIAIGQILHTLPKIPEAKDAQYWRLKAAQIVPTGQRLSDEMFIPFTASSLATGGYIQSEAASLTVPNVIHFALPENLPGGDHRVSILVDPSPVVDIMGAQNIQGTGGTEGGATFVLNPPTIQEGIQYVVVGGSGVTYNSILYLPDQRFTGLKDITAYLPSGGSTLRQYSTSWKLALPTGPWKVSLEYTNLLGTTTGFGLRALYSAPGQEPVIVIQDTVEQPFTGENGTIATSVPVGFDVTSTAEFVFSVLWTYGDGQLQIRRIIFESDQITQGRYIVNATLGGNTSPLDVIAEARQPGVFTFEFTTSAVTGPVLDLGWTSNRLKGEPVCPVRFKQIHVQQISQYNATPNTLEFQGWRQEMTERAFREVQNAFTTSIVAYGTDTPAFRHDDQSWDSASTEEFMAFIEVFQPRLREMPDIQDGDVRPGRQYEVTAGAVTYGAFVYSLGQKFYGTEEEGINFTGGEIKQIGAFSKAKPGDLGRLAILPHSLLYDSATSRVIISGSGTQCFPEMTTLQPWMMDVGIYAVAEDFWMPETLDPAPV